MSDNNYLDDILYIIIGGVLSYFFHVILYEYKYIKTWSGIGLYSLFGIIIVFLIYIGQLIYYKGNIPPNKPYRRRTRRSFHALDMIIGIGAMTSIILLIILYK